MKKICGINDEVKSNIYKDWSEFYRGNIILDEDGWFEGYLSQVGYTYACFIFGIYHKEGIMELYYCHGDEPLVFHGTITRKSFKGSFKHLGDDSKSDYEHRIILVKTTIGEVKMQEKLSVIKSKLKESHIDFYNNIYNKRKELNDILLSQLESEMNGEDIKEKSFKK